MATQVAFPFVCAPGCTGIGRWRSHGDGPALRAGVVIRLDGVAIHGVDDLIRVLDRDRIGRTVDSPKASFIMLQPDAEG